MGFRVTFVAGATSATFACSAGGSLPFSRGCFKAKFSVPSGSDFTQIKIPFTDFSDKWSSATGEQTTTCAESTGTWAVVDGAGVLDGEVVNVPSLSAPGFIKAAADGKFPDISSAFGGNLVLTVRTSTPEYAGFRVLSSGARVPTESFT